MKFSAMKYILPAIAAASLSFGVLADQTKAQKPAPADAQQKADENAKKQAPGATQEATSVVAQKLKDCQFLLNAKYKPNAKYYLCLCSASWCGPCRREMPRIAKTYAETLLDNPNIELVHFSYDGSEERALAWAKENDVKFPVVKRGNENPLNLKAKGNPHLFIVSADGKVLEEGHPMDIFTEKKLSELK